MRSQSTGLHQAFQLNEAGFKLSFGYAHEKWRGYPAKEPSELELAHEVDLGAAFNEVEGDLKCMGVGSRDLLNRDFPVQLVLDVLQFTFAPPAEKLADATPRCAYANGTL